MPIPASALDNAIRLPSLRDSEALLTEQNIHLLQQQALGFGQEQVDEDDAHNERSPEQEKGPVGDVGNHVWGRVDDDELGEPLGTRGEDQTDGADGDGEDFGAVFVEKEQSAKGGGGKASGGKEGKTPVLPPPSRQAERIARCVPGGKQWLACSPEYPRHAIPRH